jgi:hypothetical protein
MEEVKLTMNAIRVALILIAASWVVSNGWNHAIKVIVPAPQPPPRPQIVAGE